VGGRIRQIVDVRHRDLRAEFVRLRLAFKKGEVLLAVLDFDDFEVSGVKSGMLKRPLPFPKLADFGLAAPS